MKKKNLFVGLLLASAVFSLAACTDKKPAKTDDKTTDVTPSTQSTPVTPTSDKPSTPTSDKPTTPTSTTPVVPTTTEEEAVLMSLSINSDNVKKEYTVGDKLDLTGLVVKGTYDDGDTKTLTDAEYEVKLLKGDTEVAVDSAMEAATYTVKIIVGNKNKSFDVVCKVEQYKFNFNLSAHDYNQSLETPYTAEYTYPEGTHTLFDNPSLKLELTAQSGNNQVKLQPGEDRTLDGITFTDRISIHSKYGYISVTTKVTGKVTVYATVNGTERQVIIKDGSAQVAIGGTDWESSKLYKITFDAEAGKTYTINSTNNGSVVYAVYFEGSVDASTRVATAEFNCLPKTNEFDIKDNKFDPANFDATIVAADNYGVTRNITLSECTVTVKNEAGEPVEGVIDAAGVYQVTVEYDEKVVNFEISVSDPDAKIESVTVDDTDAIKTFHEGDSFNAENIKVSAKKGAVDITLTATDYTVKLFKGENEVTGFDLTGKYEVRVYANDSDGVYGSYDVNYYAIKSTEITSLDSMIIKKGATTYDVLAKATYTFDDDTTADATKDIVSALYSDSSCTTPTTIDAFANEGTVYCKLTIKDESKVVTLTVKELSSTEYSFGDKTGDITKDSYIIGGYDNDTSEFTAEFNVQLAGIGGSYATNFSTATANDESGKTFTKAVLPSGDTKADGKEFVITSTVDCYVTIYFTMSNKDFSAKDQKKGGELVINGTTVTSSGDKLNTVAYAYTFYVKANETYKLRGTSNRLTVFEFVVEK